MQDEGMARTHTHTQGVPKESHALQSYRPGDNTEQGERKQVNEESPFVASLRWTMDSITSMHIGNPEGQNRC